MDLGLFQREAAKRIGVNEETICNWENNHYSPALNHIPRVIEFLGYIPESLQAQSLPERLLYYRKAHGINQKELARRLGVDPTTLARWEKGKGRPVIGLGKMLSQLFVK
jgi:DNA-binding XRE family transcriptional regulator